MTGMRQKARTGGGAAHFLAALATTTALAGIAITSAGADAFDPTQAVIGHVGNERGVELAQAADMHAFDIPAQSLATALDAFSKATGWDVGYASMLAHDKASPGVQGTFTAEDALRRLLDGTGVAYSMSGSRSVTLVGPQAGQGIELNPITVEGAAGSRRSTIGELPPAYSGGQVATGGRLGMLGNRDIMDAPLNITSYTSQKIQDQQAKTVVDVARSDPSFRASSSSTGMLDAFFIRGFDINMGNFGEVAFDGAHGVAPNYRAMTEYVERIEVIKGPTALLNGLSPGNSVGGSINIVPKRAPDEDVTRLTADYGNGEQFRQHMDLSRRFGEHDEFGVRVNASYSDGDTLLDNQARMAHVGAVAFDYRGSDFRATLDVLDQSENFNAPSRELRVKAGVQMPDAPNGKRNVSQSWEWSDVRDQSALLRGEYDVNKKVTVFGSVGGGLTEVNRLFGYPVIQNALGDTSDTVSRYIFETKRVSADVGVRGQFDTAELSHDVSFQMSGYYDFLDRGNINDATAITSNIYSPVAQPFQDIASPTNVRRISETDMAGAAFADTLSAYDERVQLTLGVRAQQVQTDNFDTSGAVSSSYDDHAISPMVGLVVKPWKNVSLYSNYMEGLSKGDIAPNTANNAGEALAPYITKQYEIGAKWDLGNFATTLSAFQITKPFAQTTNSIYNSDGEQRNRGIELSVFGQVTPEVRLLGGFMLLNAEQTETNSASTVGKSPIGAPGYQANMTAEWDTPFLSGLTVSSSLVHTAKQYMNTNNTLSIPDWTTVDLGAKYTTEIAGKPLTFRASAQNIFDNEYWSGVNIYSMVSQGAPRTVLFSVTADF